jgi:translation initiation factor 2 alpha subunit (eIF-2alpha)
MPNTRRIEKTVRKRRVVVQEVEEVQKVDRRGHIKVSLRRVRKDPPAPIQTPPRNLKRARWKSPSPVASGSDHIFQRQKASKVCIK